LLCYGQKKLSPLREWSPFFTQHNPHPYIGIFRQLAQSPYATTFSKIGIWQEYGREMGNVFENFRLLAQPPETAVAFCQKRTADSWAWHRASLVRHAASEAP
jgi:hypothetical protein